MPRSKTENKSSTSKATVESTLTASEKGKARKDSGKAGEKLVADKLKAIELFGLITFYKVPEKMQVVGVTSRPGTFKAVFSGKVGSDFAGTVQGGRALYVECKTITSRVNKDGTLSPPRLPFTAFEPHQPGWLQKHHERGAAVGVAIVQKAPGHQPTVYCVPWYVVRRAMDRGAVSLLSEEIEPFVVSDLDITKMITRLL